MIRLIWYYEGNERSLDATGIQLDNAYLKRADLKQVWMPQSSLRKADLSETDLSEAKLSGADLSKADLSMADLSNAKLSGAKLSGANPENALSLKDTNLQGASGLTKEQLEACRAKGAIVDEDYTNSSYVPSVEDMTLQ